MYQLKILKKIPDMVMLCNISLILNNFLAFIKIVSSRVFQFGKICGLIKRNMAIVII